MLVRDFQNAVAGAARLAPSPKKAPALLAGVRIKTMPGGQVCVCATDLDTFRAFPAAYDGPSLDVLADTAVLKRVLAALDSADTVALETRPGRPAAGPLPSTPDSLIVVAGSGARFEVPAAGHVVDYPAPPVTGALEPANTPRSDEALTAGDTLNLAAAIALCAAFACIEKTRHYLNGVFLDGVNGRVVATDGHRLLMAEVPALHRSVCAIISSAAIPHLLDESGPFMLEHGADARWIARGNATARLIDGTFPDYVRITPAPAMQQGARVIMEADKLARAVKQASAVSDDRYRTVRFQDGAVRANSYDGGAASVPAGSGALRGGYNARYLLDFCGLAKGHTITLHEAAPLSKSPYGPTLIALDNLPGVTGVLMPLQAK